ncbi:hypothetical protein Efla_006460 [Eimeria flavescens]
MGDSAQGAPTDGGPPGAPSDRNSQNAKSSKDEAPTEQQQRQQEAASRQPPQQQEQQEQEQQQRQQLEEDADRRMTSRESFHSSSSSLAQQLLEFASRGDSGHLGSGRSPSVLVAVSGSGRLRLMARGDRAASLPAAGGDSPHQQQQQQQRRSSSERLTHVLSGSVSLSSLSSVSNVSVAPGQEELADLFWNVADNRGTAGPLAGMRGRKSHFLLAGEEEGDGEADAVSPHYKQRQRK